MRELLYTILELEEWNKGGNCDFCPHYQSVCQIRTRSKATGEIVENDVACENCKEKFENDELPKCENCGRLKTKLNFNFQSNKYICYCIRYNEDLEEKEAPASPPRESMFSFYERQINGLREQLTAAEETIEEERQAHEDFMEKSEEWGKRQKQELLDEIKRLKERVKQLEEQNSQLVAQIETKNKWLSRNLLPSI